MPELRIQREHALGLDEARRLATAWAQDAADRFAIVCTHEPGEERHCVVFSRVGVNGRLTVTAERFELDARLGFLLGAYKAQIEREIGRNLDRLLGES
ncbi:polyhydroxyalkanoic acid system family protein [Ramlibacter rhizophilus]|uniref:Polyhydroxyalkanoic acid synthase n=1 Tax=Ramlibacter rhizophilus TaxID=1781167 RepID=A0A4Z0BN27_9BURK|nr:polyhydroxyalkanoic acid system family protein [Ramlibacter rhizophilus]TFY99657.1 polyhydroxyalkanoic acid synthase [Ramlibacter rhizophilus]